MGRAQQWAERKRQTPWTYGARCRREADSSGTAIKKAGERKIKKEANWEMTIRMYGAVEKRICGAFGKKEMD